MQAKQSTQNTYTCIFPSNLASRLVRCPPKKRRKKREKNIPLAKTGKYDSSYRYNTNHYFAVTFTNPALFKARVNSPTVRWDELSFLSRAIPSTSSLYLSIRRWRYASSRSEVCRGPTPVIEAESVVRCSNSLAGARLDNVWSSFENNVG